MKRILLICFMLLSALVTESWAQDRTVSGKITDDSGEAIPGANIILKGTTTGTTSDIDGNWKLSVPSDGGILVFSFVGMAPSEVEIGSRSVVDVSMSSDAKQLEELVVTAMGISREKASIGYAQQTVSSEDVGRVKSDNVIGSLSGKAAGINVRQTTTMGGSALISIRGNSSFTNNSPLFVIDGVPVGNTTNNSTTQVSGRRGYDYGNPASDINPEDIESMSILKGAAATALYGSRGQNGVILITTKKGTAQKGIGVEISTGVRVGKIDKSTFIEYQDQYGGGYAPFDGWNSYTDDPNGWGTGEINLTSEDGSYGQKFDGQLMYQWDSFVPGEEHYGEMYEFKAAKHSPVDFFESQVMYNTNVALSGGNESATFRLSYTNLSQDDILPNSNLTKNTVSFNGSAKLGSKLSADVMFQYNIHDLTGGYSTGYGDNLMANFRQWWQVNVDVKQLEDVYKRTGLNYTWNGGDPEDPLTPIYWDNPYWTRYENYNSQLRDRVISKVGFNYEFTDWLSFKGRVSIDTYNEVREERRAVGSVPTEFGINLADESAGYARTDISNTEWNYNGMLNFNKRFGDDFSVFSLIGFNLQKEKYESIYASTSGGLAVPGIYALSNSKSSNPFPEEILREKELYGYFANVNLGYRDFLYLDGNYRIDVSSALPVDNNQYDYYGLGLGLVFSELLDVSWMDFGKLRASIGTVGNDTRPLRVNPYFERENNFQGQPVTSLPHTKNNPDLKPEITTEFEVGGQATFFDNRLNVDVSYYSKETKNQLMAVATSPAYGYTSTFINAGTIENKGIEAIISGDVVRTQSFTYNMALNFTRNRNKVLELIGDTENYVLANYQGGVSSNATVGQPLGVLRGTGYAYHENGERLVNSDGYYVSEADQIIGDPNPDFTLGINNSLSYKGVTLGFLIDVSQGGDVYSLDMHYGQGTGLTKETAALNDLGNPVRDPLTSDETSGGVLFKGVQADGSENTVRTRADYYGGAFYWGNADRNPGEMTVYDASYVKLRELRLTYSIPKKFLGTWSQGIDLSLVGRNLWIIHKNVPYADPESGLGGQFSQGYLSGSYPTVRSMGFDVKFRF